MKFEAWMALAFAAGCGVIGLCVYADVRAQHECEDKGGIYHCASSQGWVYIGKSLQPITQTTCDCFTKDGRLIP